MPSVVHGPGKKEGDQAVLPSRPVSLWECLADHTASMDEFQLRRTAALCLHVVCGWRLEDIGRLIDRDKGHVSREIDKAKTELADILQEAGIEIQLYATEPDPDDKSKVQVKTGLHANEARILNIEAAKAALSISKQLRQWLLAGGLSAALEADADRVAAETLKDAA